MYTVYRLNANELNGQFIEALKALFKDKDIEITVSEVDETAYLLQPKANRERLLQAVQHINDQQNLVEVSLDALQ
jgi:antitoxin YefM